MERWRGVEPSELIQDITVFSIVNDRKLRVIGRGREYKRQNFHSLAVSRSCVVKEEKGRKILEMFMKLGGE